MWIGALTELVDATGIPFEALREGGYALAVFVVIYMIFTDRLVTKKRLLEAREDGKEWQEAAQTALAAVQEQKAQIGALLEYAKTGDASMQTLLELVKQEREAKLRR